jgi:hypothetical protein
MSSRKTLATFALIAGRDTVCPAYGTCAMHEVIDLTVTDSLNGAVIRATVAASGRLASTVECDGACAIFGLSGTYILDVSAPGFAPAHRTVQVRGTTPDCGCDTPQVEHVSIAMVAAR